jgi:hypothetical protein
MTGRARSSAATEAVAAACLPPYGFGRQGGMTAGETHHAIEGIFRLERAMLIGGLARGHEDLHSLDLRACNKGTRRFSTIGSPRQKLPSRAMPTTSTDSWVVQVFRDPTAFRSGRGGATQPLRRLKRPRLICGKRQTTMGTDPQCAAFALVGGK